MGVRFGTIYLAFYKEYTCGVLCKDKIPVPSWKSLGGELIVNGLDTRFNKERVSDTFGWKVCSSDREAKKWLRERMIDIYEDEYRGAESALAESRSDFFVAKKRGDKLATDSAKNYVEMFQKDVERLKKAISGKITINFGENTNSVREEGRH